MNSQPPTIPEAPADAGHPLAFKVAVIRQQFRNFARHLKFCWRALGPAPRTPYGFKLHGNRYMQAGVFEPEETAFALRCLQDAEVFINVGANIGYYCLHALKLGRKTIAFEPIDLNVRHLLCNVRLNEWQDNFELFPVALGNQPGILQIFGGGTGASLLSGWAGSAAYHSTLCPVSRLDDVLGQRVAGKRCFVLADIEGAEFPMLQGAAALLRQNPRPTWLVEICSFGHNNVPNPNFARTFELFWEAGYSAWQVATTPRRVTREDLTRAGTDNALGWNFCFVDATDEPAWLTAP
jgi:FkbM family methyltransferase